MISHDGYKPYVCTICGNSFTQNGSLKSHMVILVPDWVIDLVFNMYFFYSLFTPENARTLALFVRRHSHKANRSPSTCEDVSHWRYFANIPKSQIIPFSHSDTGEKPYQCGQCGMNFRQKDGLKRHENAKHTNKPAIPYPCSICGKILQSKYSLKFHMGKHAAKREQLKCDMCEKILFSEKALTRHKRYLGRYNLSEIELFTNFFSLISN